MIEVVATRPFVRVSVFTMTIENLLRDVLQEDLVNPDEDLRYFLLVTRDEVHLRVAKDSGDPTWHVIPTSEILGDSCADMGQAAMAARTELWLSQVAAGEPLGFVNEGLTALALDLRREGVQIRLEA